MNPFKTERTEKTYNTVQYSIYDLYLLEHLNTPIDTCAVYLNDILITENFSKIKPFVGDTVYFKVVPTEEALDFFLAVGTGAYLGALSGGLHGAIIGGFIGAVSYAISASAPTNDVDTTYTFAGKRNSGEQYSIIPVVYGTTKMTPSFGGNDYTELINEGDEYDPYVNTPDGLETYTTVEGLNTEQYLHQLYVLGYQPTIVNNIKLGDNLLFEREYTSLAVGISGTVITAVGAFTSSDYVVGMRILLEDSTNYGEYTIAGVTDDTLTLTTSLLTESATISISYLKLTDLYTDVQVEFIYNGDLTDSLYPQQVTQATLNQYCAYNTPQYYTTPENVSMMDFELAFNSGLGLLNNDGDLRNNDAEVAYKIEVRSVGSDDWHTAEISTAKGKTKNAYRIQKKIVFADVGAEGSLPAIGQFVVRITRTTHDADIGSATDLLTWQFARTYIVDPETGLNIPPVAVDTANGKLLLMALRVKATNQLSGSISNLTCNVTRWVNSPPATGDKTVIADWTVKENHNPVSMYVDVLTNAELAQTAIAFTSDYFDMDSLIEFYDWCNGGNTDYTDPVTEVSSAVYYDCDGQCSNETTVQSELQHILTCGRAEYSVVDGKYTVLHDIVQNTPVQMFTPRNMMEGSYSSARTFNYIPNKFNVQFINSETGYVLEELEVVTGAEDVEKTIRVDYASNHKQAYSLGKYHLNAAQIRVVSYQFKTSVDALVATRGDRILIQHDASLLGISSGRVKTVIESGGLITSITVDENCPMITGNTYGITVRDSGLSDYSVTTVNGDNTTLLMNTSIPAGSILAGDLFAFGLTDKVTENALIMDIAYDNMMNATINCITYDEAVYDLGIMPAWTSNITVAGSGSPIINVSTHGDVDRTLQQIIDTQNNPSLKVFQSQPVTPYTVGSIWMNNASIYDCIIVKSSEETFSQSDWRLRSSSVFDLLNVDTFNVANADHRWKQIPGEGVDYNLLSSMDYSVSSGDATKDKVLINDDVEWVSDTYLEAIIVDAPVDQTLEISNIVVDSDADDIHVVGRYENSGYMGETYTNKLVAPEAPATPQSILVDGHVVVQCYRGTIACSYGTASYGVPLEFDTTSETVVFTITDCKYGSITETDFIPPYVYGVFTANSDSQVLSGTSLTITTNLVNIEGTYGLLQAYGDANNYLGILVRDSIFYIVGKASGVEIDNEIGSVIVDAYDIVLDWSSTIKVTLNGIPKELPSLYESYGFSTVFYGWDIRDYEFASGTPVLAVALTTAYIGIADTDYANNVITEAIV